MSNRTQILCNKNNKKILIIVEKLRKEIKDELRIISNFKTEEKELTDNISRLKHLRINHLLVRLRRLQEFINGYEEINSHKQNYLKYCLSKLIIC